MRGRRNQRAKAHLLRPRFNTGGRWEITKLAEGVAQTIVIVVGTVIALVIVGGLTYAFLTNQLPLVFVIVAAIVIAAVVIYIVVHARSKAKAPRRNLTGLPLRTPGTLQSFALRRAVQRRTPIDVRPKERLKHVVTVSLDTEVVPFGYRSEWFEKGDVIEVEAESEKGASFHFMVCDEEQLRINKRRSVNFEYDEGMEFTTQFKKRFGIPASGEWHFVAYTPEGEEYTMVTLTISKMEN